MESYEGRLELEWVMNDSMSLELNAHGKITFTEDGWSGHAVPATVEDRAFLYWGSPFTLRLDGGRSFEAAVGEPDEKGTFPLSPFETWAEPTPPCPRCETPMQRNGVYMGDFELRGSEAAMFDCTACSSGHMRSHTSAPWLDIPGRA
ncbi:hypothetical protein F4560_008541 [Saccharothrix ecbatanensis]|uniref:Uncharacterized protein n=1 Tax=Saccharothrix ecbatanensis TaxID=1105145 RepID=A0A7W9HUN4_9PSEU|nr:hypothetical protein [Saccharothrix ecbatanensis]MBB5808773.1 hypothetical protein [Saccharothrix ecbatanensis]